MGIICKYMDNICAILEKTLHWAGRIEKIPVVFARPCRSRMLTDPRPLLEFYFHVAGKGFQVTVGNLKQIVKPGELIIMNAHLGNRGTCTDKWFYWCVSFDIHEYPVFEFLAAKPLLLKTRVRHIPAVKKAFSGVVREYGRRGPLHAVRMKSAVLNFLAALWENVAPVSSGLHSYSPPIEKCLEKIHIHYADKFLRLDHLAAAANLSPDHFGRLFHTELGVSPVKYLTQYRIDRARELLLRGNLSIKEIASEVGFRDPLHFSRVFSTLTGLPPTQFKQNI
jgi:AraC-like DNA-binding protein